MRALCWHDKDDIRCDTVPDPQIGNARDIVSKAGGIKLVLKPSR